MNLPASIAPAIELGQHERFRLKGLADALTPDQALWASGFLAGVAHARRGGVSTGRDGTATGRDAAGVAAGSPIAAANTVRILFASETGNAEELARRIEFRALGLGLTAATRNLAALKPAQLRELRDAQLTIVVTSTHGDGAPPEPAAPFFEFIQSARAPRLDGVRYAVLGLGDSTYEFFCQAAKGLDRRFEELGATRVHDRIDCDVDYETTADEWIGRVLEKLRASAPARPVAGADTATTQALSQGSPGGHDKRHPFGAVVLENITITGRGSTKETSHVELDIDGSGLDYEPGDALGVVACNDPELVARVLECCGLNGAEALELAGESVTVAAALSRHYEITALTPRFVRHWAELTGAPILCELTAPDSAGELAAYLRSHHVIDLMASHPVPGIDAATLATGLRKLQPRLYSIASSRSAVPGEVHITVSAVRYALHGIGRSGVASCHLADRLAVGDTLPVFVQRNPNFRLPADAAVPIVMIGAGTGVAPFRAFTQQREIDGAPGRSWLFFGDRHFRTDFLYQTEWLEWLKAGALSRMDVAFSRDQANKRYVQHVLEERSGNLYGWLDEGAHLYVCGDAEKFAPDVHSALCGIVQREGGMSRENAEEYLRELQRDGRYQRDVY